MNSNVVCSNGCAETGLQVMVETNKMIVKRRRVLGDSFIDRTGRKPPVLTGGGSPSSVFVDNFCSESDTC